MIRLLLLITFLTACNTSHTYQPVHSQSGHTAPKTLQDPNTPIESGYEYPPEYKSDKETWKTTDRRVKMRGCEEWKARDPEADC